MFKAYDDSWAFGTPKKTGTHSVHSMLKQHGEIISPWHEPRWNLPETCTRYMIVRHPLDRLASMYWFSRRVKSAWLKKHADQGLEQWLEHFMRGDNTQWNGTLDAFASIWRPTKVFKIEDGFERIADHMFLSHSITCTPRKTNVTKSRADVAETFSEVSSELMKAVHNWAQADMERWYL